MISSGTRSLWVAFLSIVLIYILYLVNQKNKDYIKRTLLIFFIFIIIFIYLFSGLSTFNRDNSINYTETKVDKIINDIKTLQYSGISNKMGSNRIFNISTIGIAPLFWMILGISDNKNILKIER